MSELSINIKSNSVTREDLMEFNPPIGAMILTVHGKEAFFLGYSKKRDEVLKKQYLIIVMGSSLENVRFDDIVEIPCWERRATYDSNGVYPKKLHVWGSVYGIFESSSATFHLRHLPEGGGICGPKKIIHLTKDEVRRFLLNQVVAESMLDFSLSKQLKENKGPNYNWLLGRSSGMTLMFRDSLMTGDLKVMVIHHRVHYMAFVRYRPNSVFIANRNFASIPPWSKGLMVAYTDDNIGCLPSDEVTIEGAAWQLGCIVRMCPHRTIIVPMSVDEGGVIRLREGLRTFVHGQHRYTMHFLSVVNMEMVGSGGHVLASGIGPSRYIFTKKDRNIITYHEVQGNKDGLMRALSFHANTSMTSQLMIEMGYLRDGQKMKLVGTKGMHLVILTGPIAKLKSGTNGGNFLCPLIQARKCQNKHEQKSFDQDYVAISPETRKDKRFTELTGDEEMVNKTLLSMVNDYKTKSLRCFDARNYPNGLAFVYRQDETKKIISIECELACDDNYSASEIHNHYGIMLSQWVPNQKIYRITMEQIAIAQRFYSGSNGFGNGRLVSESIGVVAYSGEKGSGRAIPNPSSDSNMNKHMQYDRNKWNQTYGSIHNKTFNILTKQAAEFSQYANPLIDGLLINVRRSLGNLDKKNIPLRRNCAISVCSFGDEQDKTDGFSNTAHVDVRDKFGKDVQLEIKKIIDNLDRKATVYAMKNNSKLTEELAYLRELIELGDGDIGSPTVIGYDIVDSGRGTVHSTMNADFVMVGLGVSVRLTPQLYHYFFGNIFVHGTALPITSYEDGKISTFAKKHNVFAWGIAKPMNNPDESSSFHNPVLSPGAGTNTMANMNRVIRSFKTVV